MCTAAWQHFPGGYELAFNRDELWNRALSLDPKFEDAEPLAGFCSRDGTAGGTWLFVNETGLTLALLNAYPDEKIPPPGKRSRGEIPLIAKQCETINQVADRLQAMNLEDYAPFYLIALSPDEEAMFYWNSDQLQAPFKPEKKFATSSSVNPEHVRRMRTERFESLGEMPLSERLADSFAINAPEAIQVSRDDGGTVSRTSILVTAEKLHYSFARIGDKTFSQTAKRLCSSLSG